MSAAVEQWVNLYRPTGNPWNRSFQLATMGWALAATALGLAGLSAWAWFGVRDSEQQVSQVVGQARVRSDLLSSLGERFVATGQLDRLQRQVDELQRTASGLQLVLQRLGSAEFGRTEGFSNTLAGVARARIDGVWIRRMVVSGVDGRMDLRGDAADAGLLPDYLQSLGRQPALSRTGISDFAIETTSDEAASALVTFHISQIGTESGT